MNRLGYSDARFSKAFVVFRLRLESVGYRLCHRPDKERRHLERYSAHDEEWWLLM